MRRGGRREIRISIAVPRRHPEEHARTRCVISDCLPGFVGGWVVVSSGVAGIGWTRERGRRGEREPGKGRRSATLGIRSCDLRAENVAACVRYTCAIYGVFLPQDEEEFGGWEEGGGRRASASLRESEKRVCARRILVETHLNLRNSVCSRNVCNSEKFIIYEFFFFFLRFLRTFFARKECGSAGRCNASQFESSLSMRKPMTSLIRNARPLSGKISSGRFSEKLPIQAHARRVEGGLVADLISPSGEGVLVELCGSWRRH